MQAQALRTDQTQEVLTAQQSLQSIQTLLRAGLGCITYLRNLLPAENFSESYLTSASAESQSSAPSVGGSFASDSSKRNVSGFKIMTVSRGYTEEADKLMDYLENGIFDALQKQYLRSFIFAIYLDNDDPNNIVEAYTFNFRYHTIPGTNVTVPVMSLGDDLMNLSISGRGKKSDPVSDATRKGKVPTLGEVKRSLKTLIKNLIQATTQMDALPSIQPLISVVLYSTLSPQTGRRYATFKLYYYDHTPDDYEPPYFRAGDSKKDKWFFSTHEQTEVPEKCSIGQVQTGWHAVDLSVTSVSAYLPSTEDNNAPFLGTTAEGKHPCAPMLTPTEEAALRTHQAEVQRQDAQERRVVWDAEEGLGDLDADAEGEDDEEGVAAAIWRPGSKGLEFVGPLGIRDSEGRVIPLSESQEKLREPSPPSSVCFEGEQEKVLRHVRQLQLPVSNSGDLTQTQQIEPTQIPASELPSSSPPSSPSPPTPTRHNLRSGGRNRDGISSPPSQSLLDYGSSAADLDHVETIDTQALKEVVLSRQEATKDQDAEMLDMETQIQPLDESQEDPIRSFSTEKRLVPTRSLSVSEMGSHKQTKEEIDIAVDCVCGVTIEDCDGIWCDGCSKWSHVWCMGYHTAQAKNIPENYTCFDCQVRADRNWDLILVHNLHPRMMDKFKDLALFRRAIKVSEKRGCESLKSFTNFIACEPLVAGQLFRRLESEGFIALEVQEQDELGLIETRSRQKKKGGKAAKKQPRRKAGQKQTYAFVRSMVNSQEYKDYFDPNSEAEKRLLGLADLNPKRSSRAKDQSNQAMDVEMDDSEPGASTAKGHLQDESQTQPETQFFVPDSQEEDLTNDLKRKDASPTGTQDVRKTKKAKISIGAAVDLGD
ncbi:HORMA domain-containing protein [Irpex rosettiformis]|uniref:HORMA domain-containing protein n=1 Tax=Irpex rosettiformis TaxID=378272 RepID=A0ACB8UH18_9APHY|nr:HORMA domain-containing protein [Irpex rosettiformis]